jgi:2',3'-cyclic-nucleotide 2'-phosphodiesterase (5'-nucleotidase family)
MRPGILVLLALAAATTAAATPETARLVILSTTDLHGHVYPTTYFKPVLV